MYSATTLIALLFAGSGLVSGHGIIKKLEVNGKTYPGALGPGSDPSNSPVRAVASGDPIDDETLPSMACGTSAKNAPLSAAVKAGDNVQVYWQAETGIDWFHNVGPMLTYMAKCTGDCKDFTPDGSTNWFKISEQGLKSDGTSWYQADMNNGSPATVTIPSGLSDGNYLFRHEIIALQNGQTKDKAEFYPNCVQMTVSGGAAANANVSPSPTTHFPGAYKDTDPGILVNVYNPGFKYVMPGPAVASIAKGSSTPSSGGGDDSSSSAAPAPSAPAASSAPANAAPSPTDAAPSSSADVPAPSSTSTKGSGTCRRKRSTSKAKRDQKRALRSHAKRRIAEVSY